MRLVSRHILRALAAPYPAMTWAPTGGITVEEDITFSLPYELEKLLRRSET